MTICKHCKKVIKDIPFECKHCNGKFCTKHRLPESHNCKEFKIRHAVANEDFRSKVKNYFSERKKYSTDIRAMPASEEDTEQDRDIENETISVSLIWPIIIIIVLVAGIFLVNIILFNNQNDNDINAQADDTANLEAHIEEQPTYDLNSLEKQVFEGINDEREKTGLQRLIWNDAVAVVARKHSQELASYNEETTDPSLLALNPLIYHEGFTFGFYHDERLKNSGIYYFGLSAENIAANTWIKERFYETYIPYITPLRLTEISPIGETDAEKSIRIFSEISDAEQEAKEGIKVQWIDIKYKTQEELAKDFVTQWINSPGHRSNILLSDINETGIGIAQVNDYFIATQVFIERVNCGFETGPCCKKEGYYNYCYVPLKCTSIICSKE